MSVEFSNTYQEILLDNLFSIIKQNFVFQTQLKLAEKVGAEKSELQARLNEINAKYNAIKNDVETIEQLKARAEINNNIAVEKDRIQFALNEMMIKNAALTKKLEEKETEIEKLKEEISKNKKIVPVSTLKIEGVKKKKEPVEPAKLIIQKVDDGSSF